MEPWGYGNTYVPMAHGGGAQYTGNSGMDAFGAFQGGGARGAPPAPNMNLNAHPLAQTASPLGAPGSNMQFDQSFLNNGGFDIGHGFQNLGWHDPGNIQGQGAPGSVTDKTLLSMGNYDYSKSPHGWAGMSPTWEQNLGMGGDFGAIYKDFTNTKNNLDLWNNLYGGQAAGGFGGYDALNSHLNTAYDNMYGYFQNKGAFGIPGHGTGR